MSHNNSQTNEEAERLEEIGILQDQIRQIQEELNTHPSIQELELQHGQIEQEMAELEGQIQGNEDRPRAG